MLLNDKHRHLVTEVEYSADPVDAGLLGCDVAFAPGHPERRALVAAGGTRFCYRPEIPGKVTGLLWSGVERQTLFNRSFRSEKIPSIYTANLQ